MSRNLKSIAVELPASEGSNTNSFKADAKLANGRWTKEEHQRFIDAIKIHGKNWKKVEEYVGTRSGAQVRSHAQKFFLKLEKELKNKPKKVEKKFSDESLSNHGDHFSDFEKVEENLKGNLPFHEVSENLTEASENAKTLPSSLGSPLLHKIAEAKTKQLELEADSSKVSFSQKLMYHQSVFLELMNYFSKFNKTSQSLKLSDFVDLSSRVNDENAYEFPVGGKKVKVL